MSKELLEALSVSFEAFKSTNDQRLAELEKRNGVAELEEKLNKQDLAIKGTEDQLKEIAALKAANEAQRERLDQMELKGSRPGKTTGAAAEDSEYKNAFVSGFMRKGRDIDSGISQKAGQTVVDSDGGYAVPDGMDKTIIKMLYDQSPMRRLSKSLPIGQAAYQQLVADGRAASSWVGETDTRNETDSPTLALFKPAFGELAAEPATTQTLLDDAFFNVADWYEEEVAMTFAEQEGIAFVTGDGVNKPMGLIAYPTSAAKDSARAYGTIQHIETALAGTVGADDLISMVYSLKSGYRQNSNWMLNGTTLTDVRKLKDSNGNYLWQPSMILGQPSTLLGYGVEEDESFPETASGALSIAFADFKRAYKIFDVVGIRMLRDPLTRKGYVKFYTTKRVGGGCPNTQAVKLLKIQ